MMVLGNLRGSLIGVHDHVRIRQVKLREVVLIGEEVTEPEGAH